jgi:putative nucleotidyltransferase with HDIG domain
MKNHLSPMLVPPNVDLAVKTLEKAGFEAYVVGGCVRDIFLNKKPKDWDITTNANPEQIIGLFKETFYTNTFGTVGVVFAEETDPSVKIIEITPYRLEATYSDFRRPDNVTFTSSIHDDLKRRDFSINAIAAHISSSGHIDSTIDDHEGIKDIKDKVIRAVGLPSQRFSEDALRILRAIRLASELNFVIEADTEKAIVDNAELLKNISWERIRDEITRIIMSEQPAIGFFMAQKLGILKIILPELEEAVGVTQNQAHAYDVWIHLLKSLQHAADKRFPLEIRLAALFHDIAKPETKRVSRENGQISFYGHEVVGSRVTKKILERLKFPSKTVEKVVTLVRWHMFFSDTEQITLSAVRRMIANVGKENIWDLINVRICDRIGTGRPKESPYRLRKYTAMIEEALTAPVSVGMLKINGSDIINHTGLKPSKSIGFILNALFNEVLDDPTKNDVTYLQKRSIELSKLNDNELEELGKKGKETLEDVKTKEVIKIRKKYGVS